MSAAPLRDARAIERWLRGELAAALGITAERIDARRRFKEYGLDSLRATALASGLGQWLGRTLPVTLLWEYPTLEMVARHLAERPAERTAGEPAAVPGSAVGGNEPIAVIGMACRFPGGVDSPATYWRLLASGSDGVIEVPPERWDADALFDLDRTAPGKANTRRGGFVAGVDRFDAAFFGISPREAEHMDPQQRLLLELAWEAFEDAAIPATRLAGSATGVWVGAMWSDYARLIDDPRLVDQHTATGLDTSIFSARIAYTFGLQGPALTVNTACSSSLIAVHLACQSLRSGESRLAVAGGVHLMTSPTSTVAMTKFGALSPDGRCKAFDARADGYVRGEGGGLVILKPLSRALRDGDRIACVILGSAANNDGASNGLTAPNPKAQVEVLRAAYAHAGVDPARVAYVETHGPGTLLGDPIEAGALGSVLGSGRPTGQPLRIGSVKTNLGHTEGAAGIAGFLKVALAMRHDRLPPSLHFETPNPHIPFEQLGLAVQKSLGPWPVTGQDGPPIAGVSAFGFGGTNCHVVLRGHERGGGELVAFAAAGAAELVNQVRDLEEACGSLAPAAFAAACRRACDLSAPGRYRVAGVVHGPDDLEALRRRAEAAVPAEAAARKIVLVCPGQGAQWRGMGLGLLAAEPRFRAALESCDRAIREHTGWSVIERLLDRSGALERVDVVQPVLFSLQVALGALWRAWGIVPDAVLGFSQGEIAACHLAGILSLEDAARIVCRRSQLLRDKAPPGGMLAVSLSAGEALAGADEDGLVIAGYSGPSATVLSGTTNAVARALARLTARGVQAAQINVGYASHSPAMDGLTAELEALLEGLAPQRAVCRMVSTVLGEDLAGLECGPSYWARNLRQPVRFQQAIEQLLAGGPVAFLELSPHPLLGRVIEETIASRGASGIALASCQRDEDESTSLRASLARLFTWGAPISRAGSSPAAFVLPVSARSHPALCAHAEQLASRIEDQPEDELPDLLYTAAVHREHHEHRLAVIGRSRGELIERLRAAARGQAPSGTAHGQVPPGDRRPVFVFPGHGGQWAGMGRALLEREPVFRAAAEACDRAMRAHVDWSLLDVLRGEGARTLDAVDVVQPAVFGLQIGLAALWRSWGVEPAAVVGHSFGEITAAHVAGALTLEDAARVIYLRSRLVLQAAGRGGMVAVELPEAEARRLIDPYRGQLSIATVNGPRATVLSGDRAALAEVLARLEADGVFCRTVKIGYASHSAQMDPLGDELGRLLEGLAATPERVPLFSTVTASWNRQPLGAEYWRRNLREPVRFWDAVQALWNEGHDTFVEVSPHPILLPTIADGLGKHGGDGARAVLVPSLRNAEDTNLPLEGLAMLYAAGYPIDWARRYPVGRRVTLPAYPWQRERHWLERRNVAARPAAAPGDHPILGGVRTSAAHPSEQSWQWVLDVAPGPLEHIADHVIDGAIVLPGAGTAALALLAAEAAQGPGPRTLAQVELRRVLSIRPEAPPTVELVVSRATGEGLSFQLASRLAGAPGESEWITHAVGRVRPSVEATAPSPHEPLDAIRARLGDAIEGAEFYRALAPLGYGYGPAFRRLTRIHRRDGEALAELDVTGPAGAAGTFPVHPALLDACFQLCLAARPDWSGFLADGELLLPSGIERLVWHRRPAGPLVCHARWRDGTSDVTLRDGDGQVVVEVLALRWQAVRTADTGLATLLHDIVWRPRPSAGPRGEPAGGWIVLNDRGGVGDALCEVLASAGHRCLRVGASDDLRALLVRELGDGGASYRGVVYLGSLDASGEPAQGSPPVAERAARHAVLGLVQALGSAELAKPPRLVIVTRGAQAVIGREIVEVAQAPVWGLARVTALEHPELRCAAVDLDPGASAFQNAQALRDELLTGDDEDQIAVRDGARYVARLVKRGTAASPVRPPPRPAGSDTPVPYRFELGQLGTLDAIVPRTRHRISPANGEVEIAVDVAALNFRDVMKALGIYPGVGPAGTHVFDECVGRVTAVGPGDVRFAVGDEVVALAHGCGGSYVVADARLVWHKPTELTAAEAAAVPVVWGTAALGLDHLAMIRRGERVLIHSGAGGIGLAAIELARRAGAEIFATAGTPEKRELLRGRGVLHVMDSRSLAFADEIRRLTNDEGIDVVLNSLSGDAIPASLGLLRQHGRFIEIGKTDIYKHQPLSLGFFQKNLSFATIDIEPVYMGRKAWYHDLVASLLAAQASGELRPLPVQSFRASQLGDALRHLAQGKSVGKVVVEVKDPEVQPVAAAAQIRGDGTYVLLGGLGAIGLEVAGWLVERGARHLALLGRSAVSAGAARRIEAWRAAGARVLTLSADVANEAQLRDVLAEVRRAGPPVRGVFHLAGLLEDRTLLEADPGSFDRVAAPKIAGSWNLHALTREDPLDLFVLFSSVASVLGSPGQAAYAAANAFLDGLAERRAAAGEPALSVSYGPWAEIGLAAADANRGERLAARGLPGLAPAQGIRALERLIETGAVRGMVARLDVGRWLEFHAGANGAQLLGELSELGGHGGQDADARAGRVSGSLADRLRAALPAERLPILETAIRDHVAQVLRLPPEAVLPHKPLNTFGVDSLIALELRNRIERETGLPLKATVIWSHPTVSALAKKLAADLDVSIAPVAPVAPVASVAPAAPVTAAPARSPAAALPTPPREAAVRQGLESKTTTQLAKLLREKLAKIQEKA